MEHRRSFTKHSFILILLGIAVNIVFAKIALFFNIPLYLDSIGTILASAIGGYLPGIIVGFFSNAINSISDPITLYYGIISIIIALTAAFLASKGWFKKLSLVIVSAFIFSFIGGGMGSVLTWLLYGFSFGSGISAPFAILLYETYGLSEFFAQLSADLAIDVADKLITVLACFYVMKVLPHSFTAGLPSGQVYSERRSTSDRVYYKRRSLRSEVVTIIAVSAIVLSAISVTISFIIYKDTMQEHYINTAASAVNMEVGLLEPDSINGYLTNLEENEEYINTEARLKNLRDNIPDIEYIYVYQIREDGCYVVFDVDTPTLPGEPLGTFVPMEDAFLPYKDALLAGEEIPYIVSNDTYGWLMTMYKPVLDSNGNCVAYAAADISMNDVMTDRAIFIIKMISLLFGVSMIIIVLSLLFAERRLVEPINAMARSASEFAYDCEEERLETTAQLYSLDINTGDEIENLYGALKKTVTDVSAYITDIKSKAETISRMQSNIIISFANMVENRDMNTGKHIKHTASYVAVIANELKHSAYSGEIDESFLENIERCAPLHDLGKIKISDAILNKPGRLTPEEFEEIKTHTTAGKEILEGVLHNIQDTGYFSEALNMAAYHHERWDGTGYPAGLKGTDIPLSARIMAVADVYDALISKRSYKEPMDAETAIGIIISESGTHFDPVVVEAFVRAKAAIIQASE